MCDPLGRMASTYVCGTLIIARGGPKYSSVSVWAGLATSQKGCCLLYWQHCVDVLRPAPVLGGMWVWPNRPLKTGSMLGRRQSSITE